MFKESGGGGGAIIVLIVIWGFAAWFLFNYLPAGGKAILSVLQKDAIFGSIISFLW